MKIEHIAIWVQDLEKTKMFYQEFFAMKCNARYYNPQKEFTSYFLHSDAGARLELMHKPGKIKTPNLNQENLGLAHIAFSVGNKKRVDDMTLLAERYGCRVIQSPRRTGDGYYECTITDPEGNIIETTE